MKKIVVFIVVILSIFSCEKHKKNNIKKYPFNYAKDSIVNFKIEEFKSLKDLIDSLEIKTCNNISTTLSFKDSLIKKTIYVKYNCNKHCNIISCPKSKNIIDIDKEFYIKSGKKQPLKYFYKTFKKDYLNFKKIPFLSDHPNRYGILINVKNSNLKLLKKQLSVVTRAYDSLDINYSLNIELRKFVKRPLPPMK